MKHILLTILFLIQWLVVIAAPQKDRMARILGLVRQENAAAAKVNANIPLGGCVIQLFFEKEEKLDSLYTVSSSSNGRFAFKDVPAQRVIMKLQCLGYETQSGIYELMPGDNAFLFTMKEKKEELQGAKLTADIPLMKQLKDTTIFNTKAIKSMEGDRLRDILEQIPGFSISGNGVYMNGVKVSRTYVNGLLIFGDEAINAVNALKADEVTQIRVYDEQSAIDKHRGYKNSRKERVLNVMTNKKFLSLSQIGVAASGGADEAGRGYYGATVATEYNSQMTHFELTGIGTNLGLGDSTYSPESITGFIGLSERGPINEYTEDGRILLDFSKHWKNRNFGNSVIVRYSFKHLYSRSVSKALTEYFETESQPSMTQTDSASFRNSRGNHLMSVNLSLLDTPLKSFQFNLQGSLSSNFQKSEDIGRKKTGTLEVYSRNESRSANNQDWAIEGCMNWTNNDIVKWRPELDIYAGSVHTSVLSWTVDTTATSLLKRQLSSNGYGNKLKAGGRTGVSVNLLNDSCHTMDLKLSTKAEYLRSKSRKMSLNEWEVTTPVNDIANSYDYSRNEVNVCAISHFKYSSSRRVDIVGEISFNNKTLLNDEYFPVDFSNRKNFLFPEYTLNINMPEWEISSAMTALTPSIEQISNRISDSNPLILTGGNPKLGQAYNIRIGASHKPKMKTNSNGRIRSLMMSISGSYTNNPIATQIMYFNSDTVLEEWDGYVARKGSMLYTFSNASRPSWNIETKEEYSTTMYHNKINLKVNFASNYSRTSQFIGNNNICLGEWMNTLGGSVRYKPSKKLYILNKSSVSYIQSNDKNGTCLSARLMINNRILTRWTIFPRLRLNVEYDLMSYDYVTGYGKDYVSHNMNLELKTALLKDASLELSFQAIDLLNSGSLYTTSVNASYMSQNWNPTYGRYFLFNVCYTFRKKK